ncbi:hypothetical protein O1611_g6209 [Lasiodiplodia mahajangana]|uniref:Uncharacterized protein n=1 Tax=Lasiodiplodia mahajangana TaxID=1108764 RepID=A0ACC2JIZ5_9PEZI|nr:hypothetical protein O1611_g6209 [Lasiodiplodia mahajangana]
MLHTQTAFIAVVAAALMLGARAGELDLAHQLRWDSNTGLFLRQEQQILQEGPANLNIFTEDLGGAAAPPITLSSDPQHPYKIKDEEVKNDCAELANGASKGQFEVSDCDAQSNRCKSFLSASATQTAFLSKVTVAGNDDFDFFCEN